MNEVTYWKEHIGFIQILCVAISSVFLSNFCLLMEAGMRCLHSGILCYFGEVQLVSGAQIKSIYLTGKSAY